MLSTVHRDGMNISCMLLDGHDTRRAIATPLRSRAAALGFHAYFQPGSAGQWHHHENMEHLGSLLQVDVDEINSTFTFFS